MKDAIINSLLIAPYLLFIPLIAHITIIRCINKSLKNRLNISTARINLIMEERDRARKKNDECCDALDKANARWNRLIELQNTGTGLPIIGGHTDSVN